MLTALQTCFAACGRTLSLTSLSYGPDASRDPARANEVNVGGTETLIAVMAGAGRAMSLLVSGSAEVYGRPRPEDLPLTETAATMPTHAYGRSKLAQERAALGAAADHQIPVAVTRSFNHTGPGQRAEFVAPALARRVLDARDRRTPGIRVGNVDVVRDFSDVRDVVRAYRLLLEGLANGAIGPAVVANVATGRGVTIRWILEVLCRLAGVDAEPIIDPALVRPDDPAEIIGDPSHLQRLTGWAPAIDLERTLADLLEDVESSRANDASEFRRPRSTA